MKQHAKQYSQGAFTHLQDTWRFLKKSVIDLPISEIRNPLLAYVEEGMSWECVRNLETMQHVILRIVNTIRLQKMSDAALLEAIDDSQDTFGAIKSHISEAERV